MIAKLIPLAALCFLVHTAAAQISGADLPLNSGGREAEAALLGQNGFAGAYLRVDAPGEVTLAVTASGRGGPKMSIAIADTRVGFAVTEGRSQYEKKLALPSGTYLLRIELTNASPAANDISLRIHSLTAQGAKILPASTDALALEAADTYINEFRRGSCTVMIGGLAEGTPVRVKLKRHAFNFGVVASGTITNTYFFDDPPPGSDAQKVQQFMSANFNATVPGNSGKWAHNEEVRGEVTMDLADAIARFAQKHNMRYRMHTLLWDTNQQPAWASELLEKAVAGDEQAKAELRKAVGERMQYYLVDRGQNYFEIDGLNEQYHRPRWWQAFGAAGIAEIYAAAAEAVKSGGGNAPIFTNEYNILQWSSHPLKKEPGGSDPYANWYRDYVDQLQAAGGNVGGIGIQYYARNGPGEKERNPHSPARMAMVFANLATTGLPLSLTEFGVQSVGNPSAYDAANILESTVRMCFGTPQMNTFIIWGFWQKEMWEQANRCALVDENWNLLPAGRRWKALMAEWDTDETVFAGAGGEITFRGFYGDYELTAGGATHGITLVKEKDRYVLNSANEPPR